MTDTQSMSQENLGESMVADIARACQISPQDVEDVYDCTPIQLGMMADYAKRKGSYVFRFVAIIAKNVDIDRYCAAIQEVVSREAILRTRLVECEAGVVQVVVRENHQTGRAPPGVTLADFEAESSKRSMDLTEPLLKTDIVDGRLIVTTHHSISDQWTTIAFLEDVAKTYRGQTPESREPYKNFVEYCRQAIDQDKAKQFWTARLTGLPPVFPQIPPEGYLPNPIQKTMKNISLARLQNGASATVSIATLPAYIEAAWAWTVYNYTGDTNVSYGMVLSGRTTTANRQTMGPTLVSVPVAVNLDQYRTVHDMVKQRNRERRQLQADPAMWYGLGNIRSINNETKQATQFQTLLNILLTGEIGYSTDELVVESKEAFAPFALCLMFHLTSRDSLEIHVNSDPVVIDQRQVVRIMNQFEHNLSHMIELAPGASPTDIPVLNQHDKEEMFAWNENLQQPIRECLHDRFMQNALRWPDRMAVECHDGCATYAELDSVSNRLAHDLVRRGVTLGSPIIFLFDKSFWTVVSVVSIVKAGGMCVAIDTEVPRERMQAIVELAQADLILTSRAWKERCSGLGWPEMVAVDDSYITGLPEVDKCPSTGVTPDDIAYLQFTSGSTGVPKAAQLEHRGLVYGQTKLAGPFGWEEEDGFRILQFASHVWNVCCLDIWGALRFGGTICIPSQDDRISNLAGFIRSSQCTWALLTPTVISTLLPADVPSLKTLISGGEPIDPKGNVTWGSQLRFFNIWGPCESGWSMTLIHLHPKSQFVDPIGKPVGCAIWLTKPDKLDELVPIGSVGEVLIEGLGVGRGYARAPEQTAAAFIEPPAWAPKREVAIAGARRFYRTGDWAKYYADGSIVFVGRGDNQVKIRGQRFELGEVDFVIGGCSGVRNVYAQVLSPNETSPKELVAVLCLADKNLPAHHTLRELVGADRDVATQQIAAIRKEVAERLPSYMVPSSWIVVEKMPLGGTCKLDRAGVRKWLQSKTDIATTAVRTQEMFSQSGPLTVPETEAEQVLQSVWASVLQIAAAEIGRESSFMELGGDSILAMMVSARCRKQGFALRSTSLLRSLSLREAAASHMQKFTADDEEQHDPDVAATTDVMATFGVPSVQNFLNELGLKEENVEAMFPCLPVQDGILLSQMKNSGKYVNRFIFHLTSETGQSAAAMPSLVLDAWQRLCNTQPILRTVFTDRIGSNGGFHQIVLRHTDVSTQSEVHEMSDQGDVDAVQTFIREYAQPCFSSGQVPHRLILFDASRSSAYALLDISHALIDAKTMEILVGNLARLCNDTNATPTLGANLSRYVAWLESHREVSREFWRSHLEDITSCLVAQQSSEAPFNSQQRLDIQFDDGDKLRQFCKLRAITVSNVVQFVWAIVLRLITGVERPCFGLTYSARDAVPDAEETMGPLLSLLICQFKLHAQDRLDTALQAVAGDMVEAMAHPACSIGDVQQSLALGSAPLFDTMVTVFSAENNKVAARGGISVEAIHFEDPNEYPLGLKIDYNMTKFSSWLEYQPSRVSGTLAAHIARTFVAILQETINSDINRTLDELVAQGNGRMAVPDPYALIEESEVPEIKRKSAAQCEVNRSSIEDIFPCMPPQIKAMQQAVAEGHNWIVHVLTPSIETNMDRLCEAFGVVQSKLPILRTRIVLLQDRWFQVIQKPKVNWIEGEDMKEYTEAEADVPVRYGGPLCRFGRIEEDTGARYVVLSFSSVICDEQTCKLVLEIAGRAYRGLGSTEEESLSRYIDFALHRRLPVIDTRAYAVPAWPIQRRADKNGSCQTEALLDQAASLNNQCRETILQAAWVICLAYRSGSSDVSFMTRVDSQGYLAVAPRQIIPGLTAVDALCNIDLAKVATIKDFIIAVRNAVRAGVFSALRSCPVLDAIGEDGFTSLLDVASISSPGDENHSSEHWEISIPPLHEHHRSSPALLVKCHKGVDGLRLDARAKRGADAADLTNLIQQYAHIVSEISSAGDQTPLANLNILSRNDHEILNDFNKTVPPAIEVCVHEKFREIASRQPHNSAISSRGHGDMTYHQLDVLSGRLARRLANAGVETESIVPFLCEKSAVAVVMMLGIMKAGAVLLALDATHPVDRLRRIVKSCGAVIVLSSPSIQTTAEQLSDRFISISIDMLDRSTDEQALDAPVTASSACYVVYTSGSTGTPKGIVVEHRNLSTFAHHFGQQLSLSTSTRSLQVFNYVFDAAIGDIFSTLLAGGTVCIASQEELMQDMAAALRSLGANFASMTPTQSTLLKPDDVKGTLATLALGGEPLPAKAVAIWSGQVQLFNIYGPAEATCWSSACRVDGRKIVDPQNIGAGSGCRYWVVDRNNHDLLVPLGVPGELLIEGPLIARGYLNDLERTQAAFVATPPAWQSSFPALSFPGHRFYKTGDLVAQEFDGSIRFLGRKDDQIKLRGHRIELSEIASKIRVHGWTSVVELVQPTGLGPERAYLAVFLSAETAPGQYDLSTLDLLPPLHGEPAVAREEARAELPPYMVPDIFFPLRHLPLTSSGKIDRRRLKSIVQHLTSAEVAMYHIDAMPKSQATGQHASDATQEPSSQVLLLRRLWAEVLAVEENSIASNESFFRIGGNSIAAIHLTAAARREGYSLSVADIFKHQRLQDQAGILCLVPTGINDEEVATPPFSLLLCEAHIARERAATLCGLQQDQIEDIFPCTALQEGLMAMSDRRPGDYVAQLILELEPGVDIDHLRRSWIRTVCIWPILRTRIVDLASEGLCQVVVRGDDDLVPWSIYDSVDEASRTESQYMNVRCSPLARLSLVAQDAHEGSTFVVASLHHSVYDGWISPAIFQTLEDVYRGKADISTWFPFQNFVKHTVGLKNSPPAAKFWHDQFAGLESEPFPVLTDPTSRPRADSTFEYNIVNFRTPGDGITEATAIRAAWALTQASYTTASEAIFGAVVSGRQARIAGIDRIAGVTIATVPLRIKFNLDTMTVGQYLSDVQQQALDMVEYEQTGLQNIQHMSADAADACRFQTLILIQHEDPGAAMIDGLYRSLRSQTATDADAFRNFSEYGLLIVFQPREQDLSVQLIFDSKVISHQQVRGLSRQFEHTLRKLSNDRQQYVRSLLQANSWDVDQVWQWNASVAPPVEASVHELLAQTMKRRRDAPAVCAWDGNLTYDDLDTLSTRLALYLVDVGAGRGSSVVLCFEKSAWMSVAAMAVMKSGASSVAMDVTIPKERLLQMAQQVSPVAVLASRSQQDLAGELAHGASVVPVDLQSLASLESLVTRELPMVTAEDILYICFTSGTTGMPKGCCVLHGNFSSALVHQSAAIGLTKTSRVFDFASYAVDMCWYNLLHCLYAGACLCVPSHDDRLHDVSGAVQRLNANWICTTPTVAALFDDAALSRFQAIELFGELGNAELLSNLRRERRFRIAYGPTEATGLCTGIENPDDHTNIGRGIGTTTWVVRSGCPDLLVPVSGIGELCVEGPLVAKGYLNNPEKTAASFVETPSWMTRRRGVLYRTGDLVRYNEDGTLKFLGRNDDQVKIRGQRVELSEVELHLKKASIELSCQAQVIAEVIARGDQKILVAFLVPAGARSMTKQQLTATVIDLGASLRARLVGRIPRYLLPDAFVPMSRMSAAVSSKRDRQRLRKIGEEFVNGDQRPVSIVEPANDSELKLCQIWSEVLRRPKEQISTEGSFFDAGGDSVSAMRVAARCRNNGVNIHAEDVMRLQTIKDLVAATAGRVSKHQRYDSAIAVNAENIGQRSDSIKRDPGFFQLSPMEQFYFDTRRSGERDIIVLARAFLIPRSIAPDNIRAALHTLVSRHSMLRASYERQPSGAWMHRISESPQHSISIQNAKVSDKIVLQKRMEEGVSFINAAKGQLISAIVTEADAKAGSHALHIMIHHLVVDFVAMQIVADELDMLLSGQPLPPSPPTFGEWVVSEAENAKTHLTPNEALPIEVLPSQLAYWKLDEGLIHNLRYAESALTLDAELSSAILGWCNVELQTRPVELMIAALMHSFKHTFTDRTVPPCFNVGLGRDSCREGLDISRTVGWFSSMSPFQLEDDACVTLSETIERTKAVARSLPRGGAAYFWSRFYNPLGRQAFKNGAYEVELNFQAALDPDTSVTKLVQSVDVPEEFRRCMLAKFVPWSVFAITVPPLGLDGELKLEMRYLTSSEMAQRWIARLRQSLHEVRELAHLKRSGRQGGWEHV